MNLIGERLEPTWDRYSVRVHRRWRVVPIVGSLLVAGCSTGGPAPVVGDEPGPSTRTPTTAAAGYRAPTIVGVLNDPDITESSGLVASRRNPGLLWTHNDSGDGPFLYCLDAAIKSCGVWRVTGAEAFDWEDIAIGPGPERSSEPSLYVGDIGDNIGRRDTIVVYRAPEPSVGGVETAPTKAAPAATARAETLRFRYPDGPHNAEALAVHPTTGDLYMITKSPSNATVYRAAAPLDPARITTLAPVGTIRLGLGSLGPEVVTGADISPDGLRVALATYTSGYELELPAGTDRFDAIWDSHPSPVALGPRRQGESVAYRLDSNALLSTSETEPSSVQQVERG